jgi:protease I
LLKDKKILMIVAPENFRDEELLEPKQILEKEGAKVEIASKETAEASGMFGAKALVNQELNQVEVKDYQALVFVGGSGASLYFNDPQVLKLAQDAFAEGKIIGAICIAPSILANAGLLQGRKATAFASEAANLMIKGAKYTEEPVVTDGTIITARGPEAATEFGQEIAKALED